MPVHSHDIANNFGRYAQAYDANTHIQQAIAKHLITALPFDFRPKHILEIGCGTGHLTQLLATHFPDSQIEATDLSPTMLNIARDKLTQATHVTFNLCDGQSLTPAPAQKQYDLIISNMTVQWFSDIADTYALWQRFLSENGMIAASRPATSAFQEWAQTLDSFGYPVSILPVQTTGFEQDIIPLKQAYKSTWDFLKQIKYSGAATSSTSEKLTASQIKKACRRCDQKHNATISWDAQIDLAKNG